MNKKVIFGAFFHWDSFIQIGSHQYAKQFARHDYKVAYISKPISPLHFFFAKEKEIFKEKSRIWFNGGEWVEDGNIWTYVPLTLIPVHRRFLLTKSWFVRNNNRITIPAIRKVLLRNNFDRVDILFLDEADKYLLDLNLHDLSIYRIHDDITHLKRYPALFAAQQEVIKSVDIVVSSSKSMESLAKELGAKKTVYLPNGVEFKHFNSGSSDIPSEYKEIPSPRIIYVGSITDWFNVDLVFFTAKKLKDFSFVLIGKPRTDISKLLSLPNIYILGSRDYGSLPAYLKNADVGIIPWDTNDAWVKASHPNKLYIYMACGLPVVATKWYELDNINNAIYLALDKEEFVELLKKAIKDNKREEYIKFAKANSWENRYKKLMSSLYSEVSK